MNQALGERLLDAVKVFHRVLTLVSRKQLFWHKHLAPIWPTRHVGTLLLSTIALHSRESRLPLGVLRRPDANSTRMRNVYMIEEIAMLSLARLELADSVY